MQADHIEGQSDICMMTTENINAYVQSEQERAASDSALRCCRRFTAALYEWVPEDKVITKKALLTWHQNLKELGYSSDMELNYVKGINCYSEFIGRTDLCFCRGRAKNLAGKQFGYLIALEQTGEKSRRDYLWRCRCKCGKEVKCRPNGYRHEIP